MYEALVLDVTARPIDVVSPQEAITLVLSGRGIALLYWEGKFFHSVREAFAVPKVISLKVYVPIPSYASKVVTNPMLFARDNFSCQYCGRHEKELKKMGRWLTRDHIKPVSRFTEYPKNLRRDKANSWENVVTACNVCNNLKGSRLPHEAKMRLISDKAPKRPTGVVFTLYQRVHDPEQWEFVAPFVKGAVSLA